MKYWVSELSKTNTVVIDEKSIHFSTKKGDLMKSRMELQRGDIPNGLTEVPFSYLKSVRKRENVSNINLQFGSESQQQLNFESNHECKEVFDSLKLVLSNFNYKNEEISSFKAAKKPIIALIVLSIIFSISLFMAFELEKGNLGGRQIAILLALASLGTKKLSILFGLVVSICGFSIWLKGNNPYTLEILERTKK